MFCLKRAPQFPPLPSSERENIWGYQLWNVSILSRVYSLCFLIWKAKTSVNVVWKSTCHRARLYFPCSIKPLRVHAECRSTISKHRPITTHSCSRECRRECGVLQKINLEIKRASEFKQENERTEANDMVTLSHETRMHEWMNIIRFFTKPKHNHKL